MSRGRIKIDPGAQKGYGFPINVRLAQSGTLAASNANELDSYQMPLSFDPIAGQVVMRITHAHFHLNGLGATSGSTVAKIVKNGDLTNGVIATGTIAFNASTGLVDIDCRDVSGLGYGLIATDKIGLYVTTVPGTASSDIKVHLTGEAYSVNG